jgi:CHASE1-domain containing sensor protein
MDHAPAPASAWEVQQRRARDGVRTKLDVLRSRAQGLMEVLDSLRTFHAVLASRVGAFELEDFRRFAHEPLAHHAELHGLSFIPLVRDAERDAWERQLTSHVGAPFQITELDDGRQLRPASRRAVYTPIAFVEPFDRNAVALGFDLASETSRRQALERARDTGEPCTTRPIRLVQEMADQLGCLVVLPLYREAVHTVDERREALSGYICAAFRIGDLVESVLRVGSEESVRVDVSVFDMSPERKLIHRSCPLEWSDETPMAAVEWLEFAGARWRVMARDGA